MTILDAKNFLLSFFIEKDTYSEDNDAQVIFLNEGDNKNQGNLELNKLIIRAALKDFEKADIVQKLDGENIWVLTKPIQSYSQSVDINADTAEAIATIINNFSDEAGDAADKVNPLNIRDKDIQSLILILDSVTSILNEG